MGATKNRKQNRRQRIRYKIRSKITGTEARPRLSIFRSNKYIYAQIIDDASGSTLAAISSKEANFASLEGNKKDAAKAVGKALAEKASAAGISTVVFDRSGYLYHGRVKALAEGAREGGLKF